MAQSNAERQAKWRDANRALFNFRRRNARKAKGGDARLAHTHETTTSEGTFNAGLTVQPAGSATIQSLRELIQEESRKPVEPPVAVPTVFKDDYGRVISEAQWKRHQERKEKAHDSGWELDEYSQ